MKSFLLACLFLLMSIFCGAQILITEIMYNPPEPGQDTLEYLELYNHSNAAVDMTGWRFSEGITFVFPEFILEPGAYITLCVRESAFKAVFGDDIPIIQWTSRALVNGGELIELVDADGNIRFSVDYKSGANGWYTEADGNGASIELCNLDGNPNNRENWRPSENALGIIINNAELKGTPGEENSTSCSIAADHTVEVGDFFFTPADITIQTGELVRWTNTGGSHNINGSQNTFPNNPASFGNGDPSSDAWTYDFIFTIPGLYTYQCDPHAAQMRGTVTVLGMEDPELRLYRIGEVRGVNAQGVADSIGVECALIGIVHGINTRVPGQGLQFTIIDEMGDGIGLFSPVSDFGYSVQEGDELRVEGRIEQFRGLLQLNVSALEVLSTGNPLAEPIIVTSLGEETENRLVKIEGLSVVNPSQWTNNPGGFNVTLENANGDQFTMRVARNVAFFQEPPTPVFSLTGIGGQFSSTSAPFLDGYQILPRYTADVDFNVSTQEPVFSVFKLYPNPAMQQFFIESEQLIQHYEIYDMQGKLIRKGEAGSQKSEVNIQDMKPGLYIVKMYGAQGTQSMPLQIH